LPVWFCFKTLLARWPLATDGLLFSGTHSDVEFSVSDITGQPD